MSLELSPITGAAKLFVILEDGKNVLHKDALRFGLSRSEKIELLEELISFCRDFEADPKLAIKEFTENDIVRHLNKDKKAKEQKNLWEVRSNKHGGRIFFIIDDDGSVIVSAVNKTAKSKTGKPQTEAINRGVNRWQVLSNNLKTKA